MAQRQARFTANVAGRYYVDQSCIDCTSCRQLAPAVFSAHPAGHAIVYGQPEDAEAERASEKARAACPVGAIGADGLEGLPPPLTRLLPDLWACGHPSPYTEDADSYLIVRPEGNVLVDVPAFDPALVRQLESLGDLRWIFITHDDHVGELADFQAHFGADVIMHASDAHLAELGVATAFTTSFQLFDDLRVLHTPGHTAGSSCLLWRRHGGCLFTGDHLLPNGEGVAPVRFEWTHDWARQCAEARRLLDEAWHHAMPGRGAAALARGFVPKARQRLEESLLSSGGAPATFARP